MPPPPLLGYNNNVRHRGQIFHIQTEDSGISSPRIMTHLFADGGRIVKSTRTDYSEHVGRADMADVVRNLMKEQHKAMFMALRSGELDAQIGFDGASPAAPTMAEPPARVVEPTPPSEGESKQVAAAAAAAAADGKPEEAPTSDKTYAAPRPATIFSGAPQVTSLFGDVGGIDEKSLDDAILSYLAEEPDE